MQPLKQTKEQQKKLCSEGAFHQWRKKNRLIKRLSIVYEFWFYAVVLTQEYGFHGIHFKPDKLLKNRNNSLLPFCTHVMVSL